MKNHRRHIHRIGGGRIIGNGGAWRVRTAGLARMNMILHDNPTALVAQGNTLADPKFKDGDGLKTFDYVIANPPFSDKRWSTGIDPSLADFKLGWESYSGGPMDLWFDDVALSDSPIGCL